MRYSHVKPGYAASTWWEPSRKTLTSQTSKITWVPSGPPGRSPKCSVVGVVFALRNRPGRTKGVPAGGVSLVVIVGQSVSPKRFIRCSAGVVPITAWWRVEVRRRQHLGWRACVHRWGVISPDALKPIEVVFLAVFGRIGQSCKGRCHSKCPGYLRDSSTRVYFNSSDLNAIAVNRDRKSVHFSMHCAKGEEQRRRPRCAPMRIETSYPLPTTLRRNFRADSYCGLHTGG